MIPSFDVLTPSIISEEGDLHLFKGTIMEIRSTRSFNAILATVIDDCAKDGGQEFFTIMLCVTLNFDRFD